MNSNDQFDINSFRLPSEDYAFSNNFKPTLKAPDFDDCSFSYNSSTHTVTMKLIK